jgi:hypothetical protein
VNTLAESTGLGSATVLVRLITAPITLLDGAPLMVTPGATFVTVMVALAEPLLLTVVTVSPTL